MEQEGDQAFSSRQWGKSSDRARIFSHRTDLGVYFDQLRVGACLNSGKLRDFGDFNVVPVAF